MPVTNVSFQNEEAPCGKVVSGERHRDSDGECLLTDEAFYACGCRVVRHEYHDGTYSRYVAHHDGTILVDRMNPHT